MSTLPPIRIVFKAVDQMSRQTRDVTQSLRMVSTAANRAGLAMTAALTIPIAMATTNIVSQVRDTSKAFNIMRANTTLGTTSYNDLKDAAIDFAGTSQKSTAEVMESMIELGRAGRETHEIMAMFGSAVDLSIAGDIGADKAAQSLTNLMNIYGLQADEAGRVADMMAATVSGSAQNFEDFALSMEHGATNAKLAGMSIQEAMATSGMLANFGIRGSRGGTQMKAMQRTITDSAGMMSNFGVSVTDAQGNIRSMTTIFSEMGQALKGMTEAQRVTSLVDQFGRIGVTGASAMAMTGEGWADFVTSLENSQGTVQAMTAEMNVGLSGAFLAVRNAWGMFAHRILGTEGSLLERILRKLADAITSIANMPTATLNALTAAALGLAAAGPALLVFGQILNAIAAMPALTKTLGMFAQWGVSAGIMGGGATSAVAAGSAGATGTLAASISAIASVLSGPVGWALLAIAGLVAVFVSGWDVMKNLYAIANERMAGLNDVLGQAGLGSLKDSIAKLKEAWAPVWEALVPLLQIVAGVLAYMMTSGLVVIIRVLTIQIIALLNILTSLVDLLKSVPAFTAFSDFMKSDSVQGLVNRQPPTPEAIAETAAVASTAGVANSGLTEEDRTLRIIAPEGYSTEQQNTALYNVNFAGIGGSI